jgi:hypothetical protein
VPPLTNFIHQPGIFAFLFPFTEQEALNKFLFVDHPACVPNRTSVTNVNGNSHFPFFPDKDSGFKQLIERDGTDYHGEYEALSGQSYLHCPSSKLPAYSFYGPTSDYIVPIVFSNTARYTTWWHAYLNKNGDSVNDATGPFRCSHVTMMSGSESYATTEDGRLRISGWAPRDEMVAWWSDGATNQMIFLEKFVPNWTIGLEHNNQAYSWTGSYLMSWQDYRIGGGFACLIRGDQANLIGLNNETAVARNTQRPTNGTTANFLGSSHANVINVALGDGSVRAIDKGTLPAIIFALCHVNDGTNVNLP